MRELKYRVYDNTEKCYSDKAFSIDQLGICYVQDEDGYGEEIDEERYIVEQYTGIKDKNGKEIYEGDIVEYTTCYYGNEKRHRKVVEWSEWDSDDFGEPHNLGYSNLSECMEVIGNVHENADLLEGK